MTPPDKTPTTISTVTRETLDNLKLAEPLDYVRRAFAEWEREFREEPARFMATHEVRQAELKTYGELAADTFIHYLHRLTHPEEKA